MKNAKPIAEVDLRHLRHKRGLIFFAEEAHDLWIDTRAKPNSEHFHVGADDAWAICTQFPTSLVNP